MLWPKVKYLPQAGQWAGRWEGLTDFGLKGDSWPLCVLLPLLGGEWENLRGASAGREDNWGLKLVVEGFQLREEKKKETGECREVKDPGLSERKEKYTSVYLLL